MSTTRKMLTLVLLTLCAGCSAMPGTGFRMGPSQYGFRATSSCPLLGNGYMAMTMGASHRFWGLSQEIKALQSSFSLAASDIRAQMAGWKDIANGC